MTYLAIYIHMGLLLFHPLYNDGETKYKANG